MRPQVLQLRRLVIGEAIRFPDLARTYYQPPPERVLAALAAKLQRLTDRGLLRLGDAATAADHLAYLLLGKPLDQAMFCRSDDTLAQLDLDQLVHNATAVFVAAYGNLAPAT